jgi:hypothetical protein
MARGRVTTPASGYSGTPLARKLGLKEGLLVCARRAPADYFDLLQPIPKGITFASRLTATVDLVHVFTSKASVLQADLIRLRKLLRSDAAIWVSWPKKASGVATDITEDGIRAIALPLGFVDIKVCAVTAIWSGLKLVVRKSLRSPNAC